MSNCRTPLLDEREARPSLLGSDALSTRQQRQDERIRTLCLVVLSVAVLYMAALYLNTILVRFVLALALRYLIMPLIDIISCQHAKSCRFRIPRALAIVIALLVAAGILTALGIIIASSIGRFAANSELYGKRVERLVEGAANLTSHWDLFDDGTGSLRGANSTTIKHTLGELAKSHLSVSNLILGLLGRTAHIVENTVYILLFLAFLLAGSKTKESLGEAHSVSGPAAVHAEAEDKIYRYIRGKVAISLVVASGDALVLWAVGLKDGMWLVFSVLTFLLNFVPNVGMAIGCCLPMPMVLLDPHFGPLAILIAFIAPLTLGLIAKDVLEPWLIGGATSLTPVAVLLSVMLWGSVWGLTGMVLAVPLTAVIRIYLAGLEHPLPRYFALVLSGRQDEEGGGHRHHTKEVAPI